MSQSKVYQQSGKRFVVSMEYFIRQQATTKQLREMYYSLMDLDKIHTINNCKNVMGVSCKQTPSDIIRIHKEYGINLKQEDTSILEGSYFVGEFGSSKEEKSIGLSEMEVKKIANDMLHNCNNIKTPFEMEFLKRCKELQKEKYNKEKIVSGGADPSINKTTSVSTNKIPTIPPKLKIPIFLTPDGKYIDVDGEIYIPDYITNLDIDIEKEQYKFILESTLQENKYILKTALHKKYGETSANSVNFIEFKEDLKKIYEIEKEVTVHQYHQIKYNMLDLNYLLEMQKILKLIKQTKNGEIRYDKMNSLGLIVGISEYSRNRKSQYIFLNKDGEFIDENGVNYMPMYETTFRKVYMNKNDYEPFIMYLFDVIDKSELQTLKDTDNLIKLSNFIESNPYIQYHYHKLNPDGDKDYETWQNVKKVLYVAAMVIAIPIISFLEVSEIETACSTLFKMTDLPGYDIGTYIDNIVSGTTNDVFSAAEIVLIETYKEAIILVTNPGEVIHQIIKNTPKAGNYLWENVCVQPWDVLKSDFKHLYDKYILENKNLDKVGDDISKMNSNIFSDFVLLLDGVENTLEAAYAIIFLPAGELIVDAAEVTYNDVIDPLIVNPVQVAGEGTYDIIRNKDDVFGTMGKDIVSDYNNFTETLGDAGTTLSTYGQDGINYIKDEGSPILTDLWTGVVDIADVFTQKGELGRDIAEISSSWNSELTNIDNFLAYIAGIRSLTNVTFTQYISDLINNATNEALIAYQELWGIPYDLTQYIGLSSKHLEDIISNDQEWLKENKAQMLADLHQLEGNCADHNWYSGGDSTSTCPNMNGFVQESTLKSDAEFLQTYRAHFQDLWMAEGVAHGFSEQQIIDGYNNHETEIQIKQMDFINKALGTSDWNTIHYLGENSNGVFVGFGAGGTDQVTLPNGDTIYLTPAQRYFLEQAHNLSAPITNDQLQNIINSCPSDYNQNTYAALAETNGGFECWHNPADWNDPVACLNDKMEGAGGGNVAHFTFISSLDTTNYQLYAGYWDNILLEIIPTMYLNVVDYFNNLVDDIFASQITVSIEENARQLVEGVAIISINDIAIRACNYQIYQLKLAAGGNKLKIDSYSEIKEDIKKLFKTAYKSHILKEGDIFYRANKLLLPKLKSQIEAEKEKSKNNIKIKNLRDQMYKIFQSISNKQKEILLLVTKQTKLDDQEKNLTLNINKDNQEQQNLLLKIKNEKNQIKTNILKANDELLKMKKVIEENINKKDPEVEKNKKIMAASEENLEIRNKKLNERDKDIKDMIEVEKLNKNEKNSNMAQ